MPAVESSSQRIITQEIVIKKPEDVIASLIARIGREEDFPNYVKRLNAAVKEGTILEKAPQIIADLFDGGVTLLFMGESFYTNRTDKIYKEDYLPAFEAIVKEARAVSWPDWVAAPIIYDDLWPNPIGAVIMQEKNTDPEKFAEAVEILAQNLRIHLERMGSSGNIAKPVLKYSILHPDKLKGEGELRQVTAVFLDIEGFTPLSESTQPKVLLGMVNRMFTPTIEIFEKYGGVIDKFTGDGLMIGFNYPVPQDKPNSMAVFCSLKVLDEVTGKIIKIRMGLHTGTAVVGRIGSTDPNSRSEITALGETINVAQRIENACKDFGVQMLISQDVKEACEEEGSELKSEYKGLTKVKGLSYMIPVYSVVDISVD